MMEESVRTTAGQATRARAPGRGAVYIDSVTLALVLALLLFGLVMVTSASISVAAQDTGNPFYFLERQLIAAAIGVAGAVFVFCFRCERLESLSPWLLLGAGPEPGREPASHAKDVVKKAVKCDMCKDLPGGAACVRACPTGAAIRVSPERFLAYAAPRG